VEPIWPKVPDTTIVDNAGANQITWTCRASDDIPANAFALIMFDTQSTLAADDSLGTGASIPAGIGYAGNFVPVGGEKKFWIPEGIFVSLTGRRVDVRTPFRPSAGSLAVQLKFQ